MSSKKPVKHSGDSFLKISLRMIKEGELWVPDYCQFSLDLPELHKKRRGSDTEAIKSPVISHSRNISMPDSFLFSTERAQTSTPHLLNENGKQYLTNVPTLAKNQLKIDHFVGEYKTQFDQFEHLWAEEPAARSAAEKQFPITRLKAHLINLFKNKPSIRLANLPSEHALTEAFPEESIRDQVKDRLDRLLQEYTEHWTNKYHEMMAKMLNLDVQTFFDDAQEATIKLNKARQFAKFINCLNDIRTSFRQSIKALDTFSPEHFSDDQLSDAVKNARHHQTDSDCNNPETKK